MCESRYLACEDFFVTEIVADSRQCRSVGGQRDRGPRAALFFITTYEFRGDVLGVGRAAAVAAEKDLTAGDERVADHPARLFDLG